MKKTREICDKFFLLYFLSIFLLFNRWFHLTFSCLRIIPVIRTYPVPVCYGIPRNFLLFVLVNHVVFSFFYKNIHSSYRTLFYMKVEITRLDKKK